MSLPGSGVTLRGVLARPAGDGPFPAYIHVHGSVQAQDAGRPAWTGLAPGSYLQMLAREGYVVLRLSRRGHFGSDGTTSNYHIDQSTVSPSGYAVFSSIETDAKDVVVVAEHLRSLSFVDPERVAVGGHSVGGVVSVLAAGRDPRLRGVVSLAGGFSWTENGRLVSPAFVDRAWKDSAKTITAPVLILWSKNDTNLNVHVGRDLADRLKKAGKPVQMIVYPPYGPNGHFLFNRAEGTSPFVTDVLRFLNDHIGARP